MIRSFNTQFKCRYPVVACGADGKGSITRLYRGRIEHEDGFGDLSRAGNYQRYKKALYGAISGYKGCRIIFACDLHPDYFSSSIARDAATRSNGNIRLFPCQHHEAHIASCAAGNSVNGDFIGFAFDGTGYGPGGKLWGSEIFYGSVSSMKHLGSLRPVPLPGLDMAAREPWRMALSHLEDAGMEEEAKKKLGVFRNVVKAKYDGVKAILSKTALSPLTTSAGRLFDGAGAIILSLGRAMTREAEVPALLESIASKEMKVKPYGIRVEGKEDDFSIDTRPAIRGIAGDLLYGLPNSVISARFHETVARYVLMGAKKARGVYKTDMVLLSGGVFFNKILSGRAKTLLENEGFIVRMHERSSPRDGSISIGQAAIAAARSRCA